MPTTAKTPDHRSDRGRHRRFSQENDPIGFDIEPEDRIPAVALLILSGSEADQPEWLTEIRRHIVRFEQEADRLRAESQQADLRARELAEHARQVQSRADELHRYLATAFPPEKRPSLPGQVLRQE